MTGVGDPSEQAFDLRAFTHEPLVVRPADVGAESLGGLGTEPLLVLHHLRYVERSGLHLMRDVLVTPTHADARVTAFLTTWAYEQYWLADTLTTVLEANHNSRPERDSAVGRVRRVWDDRARPTVTALRTNLLGSEVVAGHLVSGLLDTRVTALSYARLAAVEPRLAPLARAAQEVKARHAAFYRGEAAERLAESDRARRHARRTLGWWRWPGTRYGEATYVSAVLRYLYRDPASEAGIAAVDASASALPGLAGVQPVRAALGRFARRGVTRR